MSKPVEPSAVGDPLNRVVLSEDGATFLTAAGVDVRGAVARNDEVPFVGPFRRLLGWLGLSYTAAGEYIERTAA